MNATLPRWARERWQRVRPRLEHLATRLGLDRVSDRQILVAAGVALILAVVTWQRCGLEGCPNVNLLGAYQPDGATELLDRNGVHFANLAPVRYQVVPLKSLPKHIPAAFLAVEDRRFFRHNGVDWPRVAGAAIANLKARGVTQGSSTVTMQLARNLFPKQLPQQERSLRRKLLEVRVARAIERQFEKDEILELYLNHIYFGNGAYGIEAAAQQYFRKHARELTISQAALLAALPKAPAHYDPRRRAERAKERRNLVLTLMEDQDLITGKQASDARRSALRVSARARRGTQDDGFAPYYVDGVRRILEDKFGDLIYERRLRVHTTLDIAAQKAAEEEVAKQLRAMEDGQYGRLNGPRYVSAAESNEQGTRYVQGSAVLLEVATGDVIALVGGRDFLDSPFNRATQSHRQIGSAFKPFVFAAAIGRGFTTSQMLVDEPIAYTMSRQVVWEPRNYDGEFYGEVSLRQALVESRNVPTVRLASEVGLDNVKVTAQRAGISGDLPLNPSMPLGTVTSSPLELARAYTVFPGLGTQPEPRFIEQVEDADGEVLWSTDVVRTTGNMDPRVAYVLTDIMRDVVDHGTGAAVRGAGFYGASAGKTGTTNEGTDAWFIGYTPDLVGAVWVGFDQRRSVMGNANGGRLAAPIWGRIMKRVYDKREDPGDFQVPAGIIYRMIDPSTGLALEDGCNPRWDEPTREIFVAGSEPELSCPHFGNPLRWIGGLLRGLKSNWDDDVVQNLEEFSRRAEERARNQERERRQRH